MPSERQDKADLYQQAGRDLAERHEKERRKLQELIEKKKKERQQADRFETTEHRSRMMRLMEERHVRLIERTEREQREEQTGERDTPEAKQARKDLERQVEEKEKEIVQDEQDFDEDRAYVNEQIDQLIEEAERQEKQQRQWAEKRGIDPAEAARSVRRTYEEKIREWEDHRDQWAEKTKGERNRLLERLDRSAGHDRDPFDRDRSW